MQALKRTQFPISPRALLLVDYINPFDFPTADDLLPAALAAARATAALKKRLAARGVAVIYANDNYGVWHSEFHDTLQSCKALEGARGEIARLLEPGPEDIVILKPRHSAFHSTPLELLLKRMQTKELVIAGVATDMCVLLSATDAIMLGYKVWVPADCAAAESSSRHAHAIEQLSQVFRCGVPLSKRLPRPVATSRHVRTIR